MPRLPAPPEGTPAPQAARFLSALRDTAETALPLDEGQTRLLIDQQLRDAGWEADTKALRHSNGTRPQKGRNMAVAEWPTAGGPADYVLFAGLTPVAVVEAKKLRRDVPAALEQAARYSRDYKAGQGETLPDGGPQPASASALVPL